jgi:hypothetical protein
MKNIKLSFFFVWCLSLVSILVVVGCNQDEVETAEEQFKPVLIRMTSSLPIELLNSSAYSSNNFMMLATNFGSSSLSSSVPNNVGQNTVEISTTAVRNTNFYINSWYRNFDIITNGSGVSHISECSEIKYEIYFDGILAFSQTKNMGGVIQNPCPDGDFWNFNYTLL